MEREVTIDQFDVEIVLEPPDTHGAEITPGSDVISKYFNRKHGGAPVELVRKMMNEVRGDANGLIPVLSPREAASFAGNQVVIAIRQPMDLDQSGERVCRHFLFIAEAITLALQDQGGHADRLQMRGAEPLGPADRMKRIPQADQASDCQIVCQDTGYATSQRFATNDESVRRIVANQIFPTLSQHGLTVRRSAHPGFCGTYHVGEFESSHANSFCGDPAGDGTHEVTFHPRTGPVREQQRAVCVRGSIGEHFGAWGAPVLRHRQILCLT